ncbi:MAG: hypothetical protein SX243_05615 [Acidobacteriota bacterium]|nr:hypothetical protein [Acidobacteriota bacterium]
MLGTKTLARLEHHLRPLLVRLPTPLAVDLYSRGRERFLSAFVRRRPPQIPEPYGQTPAQLATELWGVTFPSPLGNAAGMFKDGQGYEVVAGQGAGFFLAGTTTALPRGGNRKGHHRRPFAPYPRSGAASNWLGLPNPGDLAVARLLKGLDRRPGCPVGASLGAPPELDEAPALEALARGMKAYAEAAVDFLEVNESCPNTEAVEAGDGNLGAMGRRLARLREHFPAGSGQPPVVVKLSCDLAPALVPRVLDLLFEHGYDGVNFGNTSTDYAAHRQHIAPEEQALYRYFTHHFGGGVSGRPLKEASLRLVSAAAEHRERCGLGREFHIVRTGGVEDAQDVRRSLDAGASLVQWYTAYFEAFALHGDELYRNLYADLLRTET